MISIKFFTFGPFQENTYILYDETRACIIIDPGCYDDSERAMLAKFIDENKLVPEKLINTHCHIDHICGNGFVADKYNIPLFFNKNDLRIFEAYSLTANLYNLNCEPSPAATGYIDEGDKIDFGNSTLEILFTPGHSPGSISFYNKEQKFIIAGDVLFYGSIGRTDLPGGRYENLIHSIKTKLFPLGDEYKVYSGHGPQTNIGFERNNNPFLV